MKKFRSNDSEEFKGIDNTRHWNKLNDDLKLEIFNYVPNATAYNVKTSQWARKYASKLCSNPPEKRTHPLTIFRKFGNLYCPNHPTRDPIQINGVDNAPCCLPIKLETSHEWDQLIEFGKLAKSRNYPFASFIFTNFGHGDESKWVHTNAENLKEKLLDLWFTLEYQYLQMSNNDVWYELNPQTRIYEATYPDHPYHELKWILSSDLPDQEISREIEYILDDDNLILGDESRLRILKFAIRYGRKHLINMKKWKKVRY